MRRTLGGVLALGLLGVAVGLGVVVWLWVDHSNQANYADHLRSCRAQNQARLQGNLRASVVEGLVTGRIELPNHGVIAFPPLARLGPAQRQAVVAALESTKRGTLRCLAVVRRP